MKHGQLKEKEAIQKEKEKQRPVVNLVSPVAKATEMAKSTVKREREMSPIAKATEMAKSAVKREGEMAKSRTFVPP